MADRRTQSDESLIVEYFTVQPLAACDALLNQIADQLRKRRPKKVENGSNAKLATEPTERKPSQRRKGPTVIVRDSDSGTVDLCGVKNCRLPLDSNVHQLQTAIGYHEFVEPTSEASKGVGV